VVLVINQAVKRRLREADKHTSV